MKKRKIQQDHENKDLEMLFLAFSAVKTLTEFEFFLYDLCTISEIDAITERLKIAYLLNNSDKTYREIALETGSSLITITRVARSYYAPHNKGYKNILEKIKQNKIG